MCLADVFVTVEPKYSIFPFGRKKTSAKGAQAHKLPRIDSAAASMYGPGLVSKF